MRRRKIRRKFTFHFMACRINDLPPKVLFGWVGSILWLLIIPLKLIRFFHSSILQLLSNNLPSFLGSAGLFLLFLSSKGMVSKLTIYHALILTVCISILVECMQLIPRPGILAKVYYVFDVKDLAASMIGVLFSFLLVTGILSVKKTGEE